MATKAKKSSKAKGNDRTALQPTTVRKGTIRVSDEPRPSDRALSLEFIVPPDLPIHYVDNVSVLHTQTEFIISFLQVQPPVYEDESGFDKAQTIKSKCVARIVLNPLKMQSMLNLLNTNFRRYIASYSEQEADDGEANTGTGNKA